MVSLLALSGWLPPRLGSISSRARSLAKDVQHLHINRVLTTNNADLEYLPRATHARPRPKLACHRHTHKPSPPMHHALRR
jgi:hypothetical protein